MKSNQSDKWQFSVVQKQLPNPFGGMLPFFGNFREDTNEVLGITSEQYGIIQNSELLDAAHAALDAKGLTGYSEKIITAGNGSRFYAEFTFANKQLATQVGDVFGYKLMLKNSFDRTLRAALSLGFMRLTCLNGASTLEKEFAATRKHSNKVNVDFLAGAIDNAISNGQNALRIFDKMAQVALSDEQGVNVLNQLVLADVLSGTLREDIKTLWLSPRRQEDKARNIYNLYNAVTEHLTHRVSGERFEYSNKVSGNVLLRLANAARHPDKFAKLILPVPTEGVVVTVDPAPIGEASGADVLVAEMVA